MKFCDKLSKLRKLNNLSQEQLAEKLDMSRQAVSKWESGSSYPDMATIMQLCKILNCSLDELVDDDATGNSDTSKSGNKFNVNVWLKEILDFITKTYNMFCSMTFKQKMKCLFELFVIVLILVIAGALLKTIGRSLYNSLFNLLPNKVYYIIYGIFAFIFTVAFLTLSFIITIHLFKIRYLDYFVTVEDKNVTEKTVEEPIDEVKDDKKGKVLFEKEQEKIVIRDPKHSTYSFFTALWKVILFFIKSFLILIAIPFIILFICCVGATIVSIYLLQYGALFVGLLLVMIGFLAILYICIQAIYKIIFNLKHSFKIIFIVFMAGLLLIGVGVGTGLTLTATLKPLEMEREPYVYEKEIQMADNIRLDFIDYNETEIIKDETLKNIKVVVESSPFAEYAVISNEIYNYETKEKSIRYYLTHTYDHEYENYLTIKDDLLNGLKNDQIISYKEVLKIKVYISTKNLEKLDANRK